MKHIKSREQIKLKIEPKTEQSMILTLALQEALSVLEMPLPELAQWLYRQIEQNPALQFAEEEPGMEDLEEFDKFQGLDSTFTSGLFPETLSEETSWIEQIPSPPSSLHEHLLQQAREVLTSPQDLESMQELIGNLDEKGFLDCSTSDSPLVRLLQSFDPPGIAATDLRHCLLLQLERRGEKNSLAYRLIHEHYDDFIHQRKDLLCKKLSCSTADLQRTLQTTLSSLSLDPAAPFRNRILPVQTPDIFIEPSETGWIITLNHSLLPSFKLNTSPELSGFRTAAQWVEKTLSRRHEIIIRITEMVIETQADFFEGKTSDLKPLSLKKVARKLSLHESTISRAVKEKYITCPRGIFPLRFFFPHATSSTISHHTAKERLKELIERESKQKPLSDEELKEALQAQGISCARRTIAKYRKSLKIPPSSRRWQKI